jgi:threonylcarbamoyladenosine tRNA methylthiotransferase MtaB
MEETISARLKGERARRLKKLADGFSSAFASSSLKTQQRVLIEHTRDKNTGLLCGYTDTYVKILIKGPDELLGRLIFYDNGNILPTSIPMGRARIAKSFRL